jgi:hypothetical protein
MDSYSSIWLNYNPDLPVGGTRQVTNKPFETDSETTIELKDRGLAALLAWMVPGLGHLYQGRTAKGVLYFVCIFGTFSYGVYLGGNAELGWGRVVYASWRPGDRRLPYLCQVAVGLPAMPALVQATLVRRGKEPLWRGFMAPPSLDPGNFDRFGEIEMGGNGGLHRAGQPTIHVLHKVLHRYFELGTVYTMIAGLLNILVIYDAWGGPVFAEDEDEGKGEEPGGEPAEEISTPAESKS